MQEFNYPSAAPEGFISAIPIYDKDEILVVGNAGYSISGSIFTDLIGSDSSVISEVKYSPSAKETATCMVELNDGTVLIGGTTNVNGSDNILFIKTDLAGNLISKSVYASSLNQELYGIKIAADGGILCFGMEYNSDTGYDSHAAYLMKFTSSLQMEWGQKYTKADQFSITSLETDGTDGYFAVGEAGYLRPNNNPSEHLTLLHLNSVGDTIWTKLYQDSSTLQIPNKILFYNNQLFMTALAVDSTYIYQTDLSGNIKKSDFVGDLEIPDDIVLTKDNNLLYINNHCCPTKTEDKFHQTQCHGGFEGYFDMYLIEGSRGLFY
jgi:hypothetical protein